jgi:ABC-2 type transport system ATP-binding protein
MPLLDIKRLTHRYDDRTALDDLSLAVDRGEIFGLLGPNGSGKTTLFRILSTLIPPQTGAVTFDFSTHAGKERRELRDQSAVPGLSLSLPRDRDAVRHHIGVVFQSPSLDKQLTAEENLRHHGHLYGLRGPELETRIDEMLNRVGLTDRPKEFVGQFSGGMRRRVELAKGLLTRPRLLLLDEPSTGLDPAARIDLWRYLRDIRERENVTILVTTHLMDEAEHCDRIGFMDAGRLAACDTPANLKNRIGADVITMTPIGADPGPLAAAVRERFGVQVEEVDASLRIERERGHEFIPALVEAFPGQIRSVSLGKPTLEDVFIHVTGHTFKDQASRLDHRPSVTQTAH